jgi:3-dehydroquinate dehydratase II
VSVRNRIEVMHGVNLDQLGRRDPEVYGGLSFDRLEQHIGEAARARRLLTRFFQTNHEGEFVEHLHRLEGLADGIVINPGAWTHYAWAIRDALELTGLPAVEVHLSKVEEREAFRRTSVIRDHCIAAITGEGPAGYDRALDLLAEALA